MAESQNIEWKESWQDESHKWICEFAVCISIFLKDWCDI